MRSNLLYVFPLVIDWSISPPSSFGSVKDTTEIHNDFVAAFFSVTSKRAKGGDNHINHHLVGTAGFEPATKRL